MAGFFLNSKFAVGCMLAITAQIFYIARGQTNEPRGETTLHVTSSQQNPRNSEGAMVTLKDGRVLLVYTRFEGVSSDFAPARLMGRFSSDRGKTWTGQDHQVLDNEGGMNVMSVSLLRLQNGTIALFYLRKNSHDDCIPLVRFSTDEARSWSEARPIITGEKGYFVLNNDRVIQTKSGRLIAPVSLHKTESVPYSNKGKLNCYVSDDNGQSWKRGQQVPTPDSVITQEPGVAELADGRVMMIIRASGGRQYQSYSRDGGMSWDMTVPSTLASPLAPASVKVIPNSNDLLAVANNNGLSGPGYFKSKRSPLTISGSRDQGKNWVTITNIENDPNEDYAYTSIHFEGDYVLFSYYVKPEASQGLGLKVKRYALSSIKKALVQQWSAQKMPALVAKNGMLTERDKNLPITLQLNPGSDNPRNSEGDFVTLKDGRILFVYSRYTGGSSSDHAPAYLAGRYSSDQGKTWTTEDRLIVDREGDMNVMSVSMLRLQDGRIALWYLKKNSETDCKPLLRFSSDEGETWTAPIDCITDREGYFVLNNSRVIQLKGGRLLMAVARHRDDQGKWSEQATLFSYFSDDSGQTWQFGGEVPNNTKTITQEPGLVELKDGRILMIIRANGGKQQLSFSSDKGKTWTHIQESNIYSPVSPATIVRIPKTGDLLMIWNNNPRVEKAWHGGVRTPLTVAISKDEGATWIHVKDIETDPDGWYCYTAAHFTKKDVLLGYCAGSQAAKTGLSVLRVTRINKKWLYK
jgi:sialidase-1